MKKCLIIIFAIAFVALGGACFYLKTQLDTAGNDILNLTATVNLQEGKIAETESALNMTESKLKKTETELTVVHDERNKALQLNAELTMKLSDTEQRLDYAEKNLQTQKGEISELEAKVEALNEELQLYHDTGISVAQGTVPPYRTSLGSRFNLENNSQASNVSWSQLKDFLLEDRTDKNLYVKGVYTCGEFTEDLHNNAENSGIKAAFVAIRFEDGSIPHAVNAFVTTDRGLLYIDTGGLEAGVQRPKNMDCIVTITVGKPLQTNLLFASDWEVRPGSSIVSRVEIYW